MLKFIVGNCSRADDANVAHENINELRELVERRTTKKTTHSGNAGVFVDLLLALPLGQLLGSHVLLGMIMGIRDHGA